MSIDRTAIIRDLAEPLAASLGLELWGIDLSGSSRPLLRLFVEKLPDAESAATIPSVAEAPVTDQDDEAAEGGVNIDQCAELSRLLGLTLDVEGPFAAAWTLEVSSPGLERVFFRLDQMRPYVGRIVDTTLVDGHPTWPVAEGIPGRKKFRGTLEAVTETAFTLRIPAESRKQDDPELVEILWPTVRRANLVHVFPEPGLPGKSKADTDEPKTTPEEPAARRGRGRGPKKLGGGKA